MKKQTTVALLAATALIVFISCKWFQSNNHPQPSIVGKWKVDSVYPIGKDTPAIGLIAFYQMKKDKDSFGIQFNADSTFTEIPQKDTAGNNYYVKENSLYIHEDSLYKPYQIKALTDSSLTVLSNDSMMIVLKKQ